MTMTPDDPGWYERPNAYYDNDGVLHLRASSIGGSCYKALGMDAAKYADPYSVPVEATGPDKYLQAAFEESAALEQQAYDTWWDEFSIGDNWSNGPDAEWVQLQLDNGKYVVDGTTDFSVVHKYGHERERGGTTITVEIKAVGAKLFEELAATMALPWYRLSGLAVKYRYQVAVYVHGLGRPCVLAVCEKENGGLTGRVIEHTYHPDTTQIPNIEHLTLAASIVNVNAQRILAGTDTLTCDNSDSKCRWAAVCQKPVPVDDPDINTLVREYNLAQAAAKVIEEQVSEIKDQLRVKAMNAGGRIIDQHGNKITVTVSHIPERVVKAHDRTTTRITPKKEDS